MNPAIMEFIIETSSTKEFKGKRVLEIGSRYVNGSIRPFVERWLKPAEYIGIDIIPGKFVDLLLPGEKAAEYFGEESFDVVICTEVLEHVKDWKAIIRSIKKVLKKGGVLYLTTRSKGFPFHSYPYDYWRFEVEDMKKIFSDFEIIELKNDPISPGVFLKARKPQNYKEDEDSYNIPIYNILVGKRCYKFDRIPFHRKIVINILLIFKKLKEKILKAII